MKNTWKDIKQGARMCAAEQMKCFFPEKDLNCTLDLRFTAKPINLNCERVVANVDILS